MPNLSQIYSLKQKFYHLNEDDQIVKAFIERTEAKNVIKKAFNSRRLNEQLEETRAFSFLTENLNPQTPELVKYFEEGKEEDVALLFMDITSFSKTISGWSNIRIKNYLDAYYEDIIPIIYDNGGEIEKLMGDGIISVFGKPFLDLTDPEYVYRAEDCAEQAIKHFHGTDKNIKVAIHKGVVNYYKVPGEHYGEYTIVGQPITDLYRLESVSEPNGVNFFAGSSYDKLGWTLSRFDVKQQQPSKSLVNFFQFDKDDLQGVDYKKVKYVKFPDYD